jgi:hypothetical protein
MVLDCSAILAILFKEPERDAFATALAGAGQRLVSAVNALEAAIVVSARPSPPPRGSRRGVVHRRPPSARPRGVGEVREGPPPRRPEPRGLLCVRPLPALGRAPALQGRRLRAYRRRTCSLTPRLCREIGHSTGTPIARKTPRSTSSSSRAESGPPRAGSPRRPFGRVVICSHLSTESVGSPPVPFRRRT